MPCTSPSWSTVMTVTPVAKHPMALRKSLAVSVMRKTCATLPRQTQRKLNLAWVEYCAGRSIRRIWRTLPVECGCSEATWCTGIRPAEVGRSITRVEVANVDRVQQVEGFRQELETQLFTNWEGALQSNVDGLQCVPLKCIARLVTDPIIVSKDVAIGVKASILGEVLRRLQGEDRAETEVAHEHVPALGAGEDGISHEAMTGIVGRTGALRVEVGAVLRNEHEAGIGTVVDGMRPGVA